MTKGGAKTIPDCQEKDSDQQCIKTSLAESAQDQNYQVQDLDGLE